jgi:outer membrane protein OmpA-like peptidoglycan-associated protein
MATKWLQVGFASLLLFAFGCARKQAAQAPPPAPAPPQSKQNLIVLLPDPEGKRGGIAVTNSGGAQTLAQPYQAVRVESSSTAPTPPFAMDQAEVRRVFGAVLDVLPAAEVAFTLYFEVSSNALTPESQAKLRDIMSTIRERRSTAISLIGHTDTTGDSQSNYKLGLSRAEAVAEILRQQAVNNSDLSVESHGDADLAVKTARNVDEPRNRRVEVIVR